MPTDYAIKDGRTVFDTVTRNGFGSSGGSVTSLKFKPDLIWEKSRSNAYNHQLVDSVRGLTKYLNSNLTDAENTQTTYFTTLNSNGYTLGAGDYGTGVTLVDWCWQAGQGTAVSNTAGSITSSVSANPTAGFSIVSYTGTGSAATVGHGLGVAPKFIVVKTRAAVANWPVYHASLGKSLPVELNTTSAQISATDYWGSGGVTSSVFGVTGGGAGNNRSGEAMIAYCWAEVAGFSKFGSYTGNGSADGPFVYTGFRPKFVLWKRTSGLADWGIFDTSRAPSNQCNFQLDPNDSSQEYDVSSSRPLDILSNGFKWRGSNTGANGNGDTYIYACFAENPFKYSNAR